jgi:SulP family sulfate permease
MKTCADLSSLLAVTIGWLWGLFYRIAGIDGVNLIGDVDSDGFVMAVPGRGYMSDLLDTPIFIAAAVIAIVGFLETMAVGGKFAAQARYDYDPDQELIALGLANLASGFFSGYPVTGSFTRTAVNAQFGSTSLFSCALASFMVFVAVYALLPVIALLPLSSLAPIIIQGAIGVVNFKDFYKAWQSSPSELVVMVSTFVVSLSLTVKEGLLVGFLLSMLKTMYDLGNPNLAVLGKLPNNTFRDVRNFPDAEQLRGVVIIRMDARLNFANTRKMKEFCLKAVANREHAGEVIKWVIVDGKPINHVDLTGGEMLEVLAETMQGMGQRLILAGLKGPVVVNLERAHVTAVIRKRGGHVCIEMADAMAIVEQKDARGSVAAQHVRDLANHVKDSQVQLRALHGHMPHICASDFGLGGGSPKGDSPHV